MRARVLGIHLSKKKIREAKERNRGSNLPGMQDEMRRLMLLLIKRKQQAQQRPPHPKR